MKKMVSIIVAICLLMMPAFASMVGVTANPNTSAILVDGTLVGLQAYTIEGNNYFKLRDVAAVLSNTSKQFNIQWDAASNVIGITAGVPYTTERSPINYQSYGAKSAASASSTIILNGNPISATAYNIDNSTYFKLRDLGKALNFYVGWENNSVAISTMRGYDYASDTSASTKVNANDVTTGLVEASKLSNYTSLKKKVSDDEFNQAYAAAAKISEKYIGVSREEQLKGIYADLRQMSVGELSYSMDSTHYSDVYGFFISKSASCAGATRAVGLCLNQLGIPYTHVNEGEYSHQWCRVEVNGTYWICDAYGMYVGPEPAPNQHPYF